MKPIECNSCGETTYILERGEKQIRSTSKETAREHFERTGHDPRAPPSDAHRRVCNDCGNFWWYAGTADRPTCSNCRGKNTEAVDG